MRGYKSPLAIMLRVYVQGWTEAGSGGVRRDDPWIQVEHGLGSAAAATVPPRHLKKGVSPGPPLSRAGHNQNHGIWVNIRVRIEQPTNRPIALELAWLIKTKY
ncbi:uncharacterized protein LOC144535980 isoform X1 [Sander vitreus]